MHLTCSVFSQGNNCLILHHLHDAPSVTLQWSRFLFRVSTLTSYPAEPWTFEGLIELSHHTPRPTLHLRYTDGSECYLVFASLRVGWALEAIALLLPHSFPCSSPSHAYSLPSHSLLLPSRLPEHSIEHPPTHPADHLSEHLSEHSAGHLPMHPTGHSTGHPIEHRPTYPTEHRPMHPPEHATEHPPTHPSEHPTEHPTEHPSKVQLPAAQVTTTWIQQQAKSRSKSMKLQKAVANSSTAAYQEYLTATLPVVTKLACRGPRLSPSPTDPFGNYYVHALIAAADLPSQSRIVQVLAPSFAKLAKGDVITGRSP